MELNWHQLYFGRVSLSEVKEAIKDEEWQALRAAMKGKSLEHKYWSLISYLDTSRERYINKIITSTEFRAVQVRITNYVTALSRGGLIKPDDYR